MSVTGGSNANRTFFLASPDVKVVNGALSAQATSGSAILDVSSSAGLVVGQLVSVTGFPEGVRIISIPDPTHVCALEPVLRPGSCHLVGGD